MLVYLDNPSVLQHPSRTDSYFCIIPFLLISCLKWSILGAPSVDSSFVSSGDGLLVVCCFSISRSLASFLRFLHSMKGATANAAQVALRARMYGSLREAEYASCNNARTVDEP